MTDERRSVDAPTAWLMTLLCAVWGLQQVVIKLAAPIRSTGFKHSRLIGQRGGRVCPACAALDGPAFDVDASPPFPPTDCTCWPYGCRLVATAVATAGEGLTD